MGTPGNREQHRQCVLDEISHLPKVTWVLVMGHDKCPTLVSATLLHPPYPRSQAKVYSRLGNSKTTTLGMYSKTHWIPTVLKDITSMAVCGSHDESGKSGLTKEGNGREMRAGAGFPPKACVGHS